jgi:hypothetical protein
MTETEKWIENEFLPCLVKKTCVILDNSSEELTKLNWHTGESNTDTDFSNFAKNCCIQAFNEIDIRFNIQLKIDVPDLNLTLFNKEEILKKKIELKSTKSIDAKLPGSTIRTLDLNMWTIICLRDLSENKCQVRYGRYHLGIISNSHDTFQDRSPRPHISFNQYQNPNENPKMDLISTENNYWERYAECAINRVVNPIGHSWQDDLVKEIIKKVLKDPKKFKNIK